MKTIAEQVKEQRLILGVSQAKLSQMLGKTSNVVHFWEKEGKAPTVADLVKLSKIFNHDFVISWKRI